MSGNPVRTIYIHIGTEKTGTTSVQSFLTKNADKLSAAGVWYPAKQTASYCESNGHFPIVASLVGGWVDFVSPAKSAAKDECLRKFLEDCLSRPEKTVVISAEHFSSRLHDPEMLATFRRQLLGVFDRAVVIAYVRSQVSLAPSSYSTGVKCGRASRLDLAEITPANPYFNALSILDFWASVFGRDNIIAREFEAGSLRNGDICHDFLEVLGVAGLAAEKGSRENTSLSLPKLEALRLVNACLPSIEQDPERWREAQRLRGIFITPHLQSSGHDQPFRLTHAEACLILDRFRQDNEILNEKYFSGSLSMSWFFLPQDAAEGQPEDEGGDAELDRHCLTSVFPRTVIAMASRLREVTVENRDLSQKLRQSRQECEHLASRLQNLEGQLQKIRSTTTWKLRQKFIGTKKRIKAKVAVN